MLHAWITAYISCMEYACSMHGIWPPFHAYSMRGTCVFHAWYRWIPCMVQAYSMHGTGVFHAWYMCILCVVQAYSLRGTGVFHAWYRHVFTVHGTGIPMHAPCIVQAYILSILIDFILAYSTCCKVQRKVYIIDSGFDCHRKMNQASWQKGQTALHTYYLHK